jgi:hypothetical protein
MSVRRGWVAFRHRVTGEVRQINPHNVQAVRALKAERHPQRWSESAWEQIILPTPGAKPWSGNSPV